MRRFALLACLVLVGCGSFVIPVDPLYPPPSPNPTPVDPTPPGPVPVPATGAITEAQFSGVAEGDSIAAVVAEIGEPFQKHDAAGFTIYTYVLTTGGTAFLWVKDSVVDHKGRAP